MAKVKCEYCGSFIEDTEETCSVCGAVNDQHHRVANDTPQTIEQLQSWYKARKLPPEETTRFFIGKNIKEPRAFGIYEENGVFTVYKNKADGSRAVRYKGTDEAYAVNEIYLRLKEEILQQKNINLKKKQQQSQTPVRRPYTYAPTSRQTLRKNPVVTVATTLVAVTIVLAIFIGMVSTISSVFNNLLNSDSSTGYYLSENKDIYYLQAYKDGNNHVWWNYDVDEKEWSQYATYDDLDTFPDGVTEDSKYPTLTHLVEELGLDYSEVNINNSRTFIDAGNHITPRTSYYYHNNNYYYFLDDTYADYGVDNSGWYIYGENGWEYYCDEDDKYALGDDLWYSDSEYSVGDDINNIYNYTDDLSTSWTPSDFTDTSWYESYESNERAYEDYQDRHQNDSDYDWDSDDDYDWDSGSDWDSGGSDWDSDW